MSERLEQKSEDLQYQHRFDAGLVDLNQTLLYAGDVERQRIQEKQVARSIDMGKLGVGGALPQLIEKNDAVLTQELKDWAAQDERDLRQSRAAYDKTLNKASKHYNRPWNKGRYQEAALEDAKEAGVEIKGWK